jgi:hypothetical protein
VVTVWRKSSYSAAGSNACVEVWRKSSYSAAGSNDCLEVANNLDRLRDSKNPAGPTLKIDLMQLIANIKAGRFAS